MHAPPGTMLREEDPDTPKHSPVATLTKALSAGCVSEKYVCVRLSMELIFSSEMYDNTVV